MSIGHTCITWGTFPNTPDTLQPALADIADLGYAGFETFPQVLDALHTRGELTPLIERCRPSRKAPYTPRQTAEISRACLEKLGYTFRGAATPTEAGR